MVDLTPVVTGLSVTAGHPGGGTAVTISGHNFTGSAGDLHVTFGGVEATAFTVVSDSQIVAYAPAHSVGTVDVQVRSGIDPPGRGRQLGVLRLRHLGHHPGRAVHLLGRGTGPAAGAAAPPAGRPPTVPPAVPLPPPLPPGYQPTPRTVGFPQFAAGADVGSSVVTLLQPGRDASGSPSTPFPGFAGGVRTAAADFNGDGVADLVVGTGPGAADPGAGARRGDAGRSCSRWPRSRRRSPAGCTWPPAT